MAQCADMVFMRQAGLRPVVVHGGGPQISAMLGRLGLDSEFRGGLRVTGPEAMDVVRMVLVGQVGRELVGLINQHGPYAVGMSGEDAGLLQARRVRTGSDGRPVDLGLVGTVQKVNTAAVEQLVEIGKIPVIASIAPELADETMRECAELGIQHVWMHRGPGKGSVSQSAAAYGREHGIAVIDGGCPCMFEPTADVGHKAMRFVFTLTGNVPRQV